MKILHVAQAAGGVDRYLRMLLPGLKSHGLKQILFCSQDYDPQNYIQCTEKLEIMQMGQTFNPVRIIACAKAIRQAIRKYRPDIVYCHSSFAGGFGRLACIGMPVKVIYNPHGWAFDMKGSRLKKLVYLFLEKILALVTDKFVLISNAEKLSAVLHHIAPLRKLKVIFNGIDFDTLQHTVSESSVTRQSLNIPENVCLIGMVGRISRQKAPDIFIQMAAEISKVLPSAHFLIVGDGEEKQDILKLARQLGVNDRLHITGWVDKSIVYTHLLDYAVLLSRWEGFGLVIAEYMFERKPVVATAVDAIPDLVTNEINGLLVPSDNAKLAAEAVLRLYHDQDLRNSLVENAYKKVVACYDIKRVITEHIDLMNEIVKS